MKKLLIGFFLTFCTVITNAQSKHYDSLAILIIDRMSDVIGDLESCSFKLSAATDVADPNTGLTKKFTDYEVYMSGNNKMLINSHGYKGHRQFMYNGIEVAYFSFDENNYGTISAPESTILMMDSIHSQYGIEFPAADFFYPAFTDDLIGHSSAIHFLGKDKIHDKEYFHVQAISKDADYQFWISNDAYNLPAKFVITYKNEKGSPQYYAAFSEWEINPDLPVAMFDFLPPPGAAPLRIMAKNER